MFDPSKFKLTTACELPGILYGLCHDAQNRKLFGAGSDWSVYCVDLGAKEPAAEKKWTNHKNYVSALLLRGDEVISSGYDQQIIWTRAPSGEQVRAVHAHDGWVRDLALYADGRRLASVGDDMLVKIWNADSGELVDEFDGHKKHTPQGYSTALYVLAVAPDGKHLASGDRVGDVCIWETDSGKLVNQLHAPAFYTYDPQKRVRSIGGIRSLCFSPDGKTLAIGGIGAVTNVDGFVGPCRIEFWDWQAGKCTSTCQDKHKAVFNQTAFHPSEPCLIAAGGGDSGGILAFWNLEKKQLVHKAKPKGHIQRLILDHTGNHLYLAGYGGFQIWELP